MMSGYQGSGRWTKASAVEKASVIAASVAVKRGGRVAAEMVAALLLGAVVGFWLDSWLGTRPWLLIVFLFLGVASGTLNAYRAARRLGAHPYLGPGFEYRAKPGHQAPWLARIHDFDLRADCFPKRAYALNRIATQAPVPVRTRGAGVDDELDTIVWDRVLDGSAVVFIEWPGRIAGAHADPTPMMPSSSSPTR